MPGLWHLSDLDWFGDLSDEEVTVLERSARVRGYDANQMIFRPTTEPHSVYLLRGGTVRIYRVSRQGAEATFGYVRPGEIFGELTAVTGHRRESYAEAVTPCEVWQIPIELFRKLLGSRPGVGRAVANQVGDRLKRIERRVEGLMFHDARSRLAIILRELGDHFGQGKGTGLEIDGEFTQGELATLVGCSRQTLNQCLKELSELGLAKMERRRVRLPDPAALREFIEKEARSE